MNAQSIQLPVRGAPERAALVRRARLLAWGGVAWHGLEMAVALGAGIAAGSIALIGFGADSLIEALAGGSCCGASQRRGLAPRPPSAVLNS